jgi:hypothetical protein
MTVTTDNCLDIFGGTSPLHKEPSTYILGYLNRIPGMAGGVILYRGPNTTSLFGWVARQKREMGL